MRYQFITFDCYGTLIDWEGGITEAFLTSGIPVERDDLLRAYHEQEPVIESAGYKSYREVLTETALLVGRKLGWDLARDQASFLPDSLESWKPFPDTNSSLARLRAAGCSLGILSNVDNDLLAQTLRHFTVDFQLLITAEKVRSYKPAHGHFLAARERIGDQPWLHAAQSYFHDIVPASELGIPSAWINRKAESPTGAARPIAEFFDLQQFVRWVIGV